jgi:hypothetical protein
LQEDVESERNLRKKKDAGSNVMDFLRQRLCKRGNYVTVEESGVFHTISVDSLPSLCSAKVNTSPYKHLDVAEVGRVHLAVSAVTSRVSTVTQQ